MKKKTIKKLVASLLASTFLLSVVGCGNNNTSEPAATPSDDSDVKTVAIVQLMDNPAFIDMRDGIIEQLEAKGYGKDKVNIVIKNAQGDATNLQTMVQGLVTDKVDVLAPIGTPATQACVNMESDIPVFFTSVSDPVRAGIMTALETPDKNATGTSNKIPTSEIIDLALRMTPDMKSIGFIYNTSEDNSVSTVESTKAYLDSIGMDYEESVVTNSSEVQQAAQNLVPKVDALYVPNDAMVQSAMPLVTEVARNAKKPIYASSAATVASGALATVAMSDKEIGQITADMIIEYLEGKALVDIPAIVVPASNIVINEDFMNAAEFEFSEDIMNEATLIKDSTDSK